MPLDEMTLKRATVVGLQPKKVRIVDTISTMVILCDCGSTEPVVIPNVDRAGLCKACKTKYVIALIEFKNTAGQISSSVSVAKWAGPMAASPDLVI